MKLPRTQLQIVHRYGLQRDKDMLGFRAEVLLPYLDYEHAAPLVKPEVTAEDWAKISTPGASIEEIAQAAREYLHYSFGKAEDHRGISATRSVMKLEEYAWLLDREDVLSNMQEAPYAQYGVPKLVIFARGLGFPDETLDSPALARMADGLPCHEGCEMGCEL